MFIGDFEKGVDLYREDPPFDALIVAALLRADTHNAARLREAFPELCAETQRRYDSPGGALTVEEWRHRYDEEPPSSVVAALGGAR